MNPGKVVLTAVFWMGLTGLSLSQDGQQASKQGDPVEVRSYVIGMDVAKNLEKQGLAVNADALVRGFRDGLAGKSGDVPEKERRRIMQSVQAEVRQKSMATRRVAAAENARIGKNYLDENRKKPGVQELPSGLQYQVIRQGAGALPVDSDMVECRYVGTTVAGVEFDSTEPGQTSRLKLSTLIPGWREALKLMSVGSRWMIMIPPQLAYGDRGAGSDIGPNETLIFDVELLAIK